jgi:hypothetical protein
MDPKAFFDGLRPARQALIDASNRYRPFGPQYHMLQVIVSALDAAAEFFTGNRGFYAVGDSRLVGSKNPDQAGS